MIKSLIKSFFMYEQLVNKTLTNVLALVFVVIGYTHLSRNVDVDSQFSDWGLPAGFLILIGLIEMLAAGFLLWDTLRRYSALVLGLLMTGSTCMNVAHGLYFQALVALSLGSLGLIVAWLSKPAPEIKL